MSLVLCAVAGCPNRVREGLRRPGRGGRELADGVRCWRCRNGRGAHRGLAGDRARLEAAIPRVQELYDSVHDVSVRSTKIRGTIRALLLLAQARAALEEALANGEGDGKRRVRAA